MISATSLEQTNGAVRVLSAYDHRHRRTRKTIQRLFLPDAAPPAPPPLGEWATTETHTYVWDGNNIALETIASSNGTTRACEYFWGPDLFGTEQGAGGVGGLLAVSIDGAFLIPCYDHNGNIVRYISEDGSISAAYTYDPFGNVLSASGPLADVFTFGFSTKPLDRETGLVSYQRRFYRPPLGRWLNRDPIEEEGGESLYAFCANNPSIYIDALGNSFRDAFIDAAKIVVGVSLSVTGAMIGAAASWSGLGAIVGIAVFSLGVDQALEGLYSSWSQLHGGPATDNSPIKSTISFASTAITGNTNSRLEWYLQQSYSSAQIISSCYGGIIGIKTAVRALKFSYVPAHSEPVPYVQQGMISWTWELNASYWKIHGGEQAVEKTIEIVIDGVTYLEHSNDSGE